MRQFVVYQGKWSAAERDFERDIIHMCESEGMGLAPWGALGGGNFKTVCFLYESQFIVKRNADPDHVGRTASEL